MLIIPGPGRLQAGDPAAGGGAGGAAGQPQPGDRGEAQAGEQVPHPQQGEQRRHRRRGEPQAGQQEAAHPAARGHHVKDLGAN